MKKEDNGAETPTEQSAEVEPVAPRPAAPRISTPKDLPNASARKPYEVQLEQFLFGDKAESVSWFNLHLPDGMGLAYDEETGALSGTPETSGEFKLKLEFVLEKQPSMAPASETMINLVINPDPRDLWKDLPSVADGVYAKADTDCERVVGEHAILVAASQRGRSHAHVGGYRDDDYEISTLDVPGGTKFFCFAVADGAGSAEFSRRGSDLACHHSISNCKTLLAEAEPKLMELIASWSESRDATIGNELHDALYHVLVTAAHKGFLAVEAESVLKEGSKLRDFHTTILLTIACKLDSGDWFIANFAIGDGGVAVYQRGEDGDSNIIPLSKPDSGEFAGQTSFFTMRELWDDAVGLKARIHFDLVPEFTALFSMTDGVSDPLFETDSAFESIEKWDQFWQTLTVESEYTKKFVDLSPRNPKMAEDLCDWLDFFSKGNHDDRTLAILLPLDRTHL